MAETIVSPTHTHASAAIGLALANVAQRIDVDAVPLTRAGQMDLARGMTLVVVDHVALIEPEMTVRELRDLLEQRGRV